MLKVKKQCEKCDAATGLTDVAWPICSGNLVLRPTRTRRPVAVAASLAAKRLRRSGR